MRNLLLFIFCVLFSGAAFGQTIFSDDFSSGTLTNWSNTGDWTNSSGELKHGLSGTSGSSYIYADISSQDLSTGDYEWEFCFRNGSWDPSSANKFWTFLIADANDLNATPNGYAVGVNFTGSSDLLTLYEVSSGAPTAIITSAFNWGNSDDVCVRVTRDQAGGWEFFYDENGNGEVSAGTVTNTAHTTGDNFGLSFTFSSTRAGLLYMDDVNIVKSASVPCTDPAPVTNVTATVGNSEVTLSWTNPSPACPLDGVVVFAREASAVEADINETNLDGLADESDFNTADTDWSAKLDANDVFDIAGLGTDNTNYAVYNGTGNTATITGLTNGTIYHFRVFTEGGSTAWASGVDISATPLDLPSAGDFVISEYMADPIGLADATAEYFEIYNATDNSIDIDGWIIKDDGADSHTISSANGTTVVPAKGFLVLGIDAANTDAAVDYEYSGINLSNGDDEIILEFSGTEICRVNYTDGDEFGDGVAHEVIDVRIHPTGVTSGPDGGSDYQAASTAMTSGDLGSPGTIGTSLPVELLSFTATPNQKSVDLTWSTASEENNAYFDVQRSLDGKNFETIGRVEGTGTTYEVQEYTFIDENPTNGVNYYRLRQVDFDGAFEYHKTISILMNGNTVDVQIYPNPTRGELNIVLPTTSESEIQVIDLTGKILRTVNSANDGLTTLNIADLPNGQYMLRIKTDQAISTSLFVKTK